ncbi:hypothetical protein LY78DRAFT_656407 [Colletotrichum sublineola]|nr:hypothetical protein LY78DRAFT_656407 [Colletotrichum sublineola]
MALGSPFWQSQNSKGGYQYYQVTSDQAKPGPMCPQLPAMEKSSSASPGVSVQPTCEARAARCGLPVATTVPVISPPPPHVLSTSSRPTKTG